MRTPFQGSALDTRPAGQGKSTWLGFRSAFPLKLGALAFQARIVFGRSRFLFEFIEGLPEFLVENRVDRQLINLLQMNEAREKDLIRRLDRIRERMQWMINEEVRQARQRHGQQAASPFAAEKKLHMERIKTILDEMEGETDA